MTPTSKNETEPPEAKTAIARKMMAYLDGEMSSSERAEFEELLETHSEWRDEFDRLSETHELSDSLVYREPPEALWDHYWEEIEPQLQEKRLGFALMLTGLSFVALFLMVTIIFFFESLLWRIGSGLVISGFLIVVVSVIRGFLKTRKHDRYRKIMR